MLCDDSAVIRGAIARMLNADPTIHVAARVANGRAALEAVGREHFDVAVLDIEMPEMDGLTALPLLLRADPRLRVIMASTLTTRGADIALRALRLGAADYVPKPSVAAIADDSFRRELLAKVKGLARLRRHAVATATPPGAPRPVMGTAAAPTTVRPAARERPLLVAVGSSTGGPQALFTLVQGLGTGLKVPVVITQHMPAAFTPILADHLTRLGATPCAEARDGEPIEAGRIYLAPGDRHLLVEGRPGALRARLSDAAPENFCRPSVDPMLRSATLACSGRVLVVMLTGMGHDGREGTRAVIEAGGTALAQDEASSVVWGMPGAVAQAGLCHRVLPLPAIAPRVLDLLRDAGKGP
ncbi:chemotaxis response regulator protein-glutamate methylesterase [Rhodovastum atsumiense]|uniref:Protein-glutamate methylesterase/protein-glutamine glutaminase n=1 Tax=Rhodovastum atsumiense TaxID=504468 RepID=A0A5M6IUY5_9PROT|nr:chemotaxis response regulator protein-glutamate methylesterase [Rhodovastum atsumiense]